MAHLPTDEPGLRELIRQLVQEEVAKALQALRPPPAAEAAPVAAAAGLEPRTLALISAAVFAALGPRARVRRVTFLNQNTVSAWAELGRVSIHASHNIRRAL